MATPKPKLKPNPFVAYWRGLTSDQKTELAKLMNRQRNGIESHVARLTTGKAESTFQAPACLAIEKYSEGKVTRQQLRPKDWQIWWPELVSSGERAEV